jgi:hypothetical protein
VRPVRMEMNLWEYTHLEISGDGEKPACLWDQRPTRRDGASDWRSRLLNCLKCLSRPALLGMVQASHLGRFNDLSHPRRLNGNLS